jgi:hypothetical protein
MEDAARIIPCVKERARRIMEVLLGFWLSINIFLCFVRAKPPPLKLALSFA